YIEPFFGGGALFFHLTPERAAINDTSGDLMEFYRLVQVQDEEFKHALYCYAESFRGILEYGRLHVTELLDVFSLLPDEDDAKESLELLMEVWMPEILEMFSYPILLDREKFRAELTDSLLDKLVRTKKNHAKKPFSPEDLAENLVTGLTSGYYLYFRSVYNDWNLGRVPLSAGLRGANFFFVRETCYGSMFRYNRNGEFNIPYGGMSYNKKDFMAKVEALFLEDTQKVFTGTDIRCMDFEDFLQTVQPTEHDFLFLDPPYDTEFSDYVARGSYFNSRGLMKTPIAVLNPLSSKFSQSIISPDTSMRQEKTPFAEGADSCEATLRVLEALCRTHRDFEILFEEVVVESSVKAGKFLAPRSEFQVIVVPQAQVMDDAVAAKLAEFTAAGGKVVAVGSAPKRTVRAGKEAINVDLSKVITHQIDWEGDDFMERFEKLISGLCAPEYIICGENAHEVISQLRQDGDWTGLWINNGTPGDKVLTIEYPALGYPDAVFDPGDGIYYRPEADGKVVLQDSQSLVFIFDKTLDNKAFAPAETAPW
ncbi:MAG: DNA adenine methylase, partial [Lentisphaeria bacterium]|nr:DNA adenine methylase [Lentisphaeria bacterium]